MLNTSEFVSSEEHRLKELPIEARHSICLEISKKRRQSVATSIFIPKELSNHIRFLKKCQRRDSNKKTKIKKPSMNDKNTSTNTIAKYKNKYLKRKGTTIAKQKPQQPKPPYIEHPESYPISNKLAQNFTSERLRTLLEVLREENVPNAPSKQLEIVEQQIPLGTDQNLTISYTVEVPEPTTAVTTMSTETVTDNTIGVAVGIGVDLQRATELVINENISTVVPKQEVLDSSYEYIENAALERNLSETEVNTYSMPYVEPALNSNIIPSSAFVKELHIAGDNLEQFPQVANLENNFNPTMDCNVLNFYGYHQAPEVKIKQLAPSMEHLELQQLNNFKSVAPPVDLGHNNRTSYTTLPTTLASTHEHPAPQSINFYHHHHEQHVAPDPYSNNAINYINAQNFQKQPQPMAVNRQTSMSCRHNLHKRHQHYLSYGLQYHGSGLEDPLAAKAWHYTMHKAQARSSRARRAANAAAPTRLQPCIETSAQGRLQPSIETTSSWHYPTHGDSGFATANTTMHPYHTSLSAHTHPQQTGSSAPLAYVPPALTRLPSNFYQNAEESFPHPVDLTMYAFYQQPQLQREPPPPYHHHHYQLHQHAHHQHAHPQHQQQQPQQPQYYSQQQHYEVQQQHQQQQHYNYPQQHQQLQQQFPTQYADSFTASYPAQLQCLSQAFAHISSTVLPQPVTNPSYWYQLQRDLLYDQRNASTLQGIVASGPVLDHAGTYINNGLF